MADIETIGVNADDISASDYVKIYIGGLVEDNFGDKIDNPFFFVNGVVDPESDSDFEFYKAAAESHVGGLYDSGRDPVLSSEISMNLVSGKIPFVEIQFIDGDAGYSNDQGIQPGSILTPIYNYERNNRLFRSNYLDPFKKPSAKELRGVYDSKSMGKALAPEIMKVFAVTNSKYSINGRLFSNGVYDNKSTPGKDPNPVYNDLTYPVKFIDVPLLFVRNDKELLKIGDPEYKGPLSVDIDIQPNEMLYISDAVIVNHDYEEVNGVSYSLVEGYIAAATGSAADIAEELGIREASECLEAIEYCFAEGRWVADVFTSTPCKILKYEVKDDDIKISFTIPKVSSARSLMDGQVQLCTGSTLFTVSSSKDGVPKMPYGVNNNHAVGIKSRPFIPQSLIKDQDALATADKLKREAEALLKANLNTRRDFYNVSEIPRLRQRISLTLDFMFDYAFLNIRVYYNPYDISAMVNNDQSRTPIDPNGRVNYSKVKIDSSRIKSGSDIFDTLGLDVRVDISGYAS